MFTGLYYHSLDAKGRLTLPAKMRHKFNSRVIVSRGFDFCLELRSEEQFQAKQELLLSYSENDEQARILTRQFFSSTAELSVDKLGRINLPTNLLTLANIKKDVVIIGVGNRIEIWAADNWNRYQNKTANAYETVAAELNSHYGH